LTDCVVGLFVDVSEVAESRRFHRDQVDVHFRQMKTIFPYADHHLVLFFFPFLKVVMQGAYYYHIRFMALFPRSPVPEENFWTLWCKGRLREADAPTVRLGATPAGLTSAHLHHSPIFYRPDALPAAQPTVSKH